MKPKILLQILIFLLLVGITFYSWFTLKTISAGDWSFYFPETLRDFPILPAWDTFHNGLGRSTIPFLWLQGYFLTTAKFAAVLGIPWVLIERIFWFWPFLLISTISSFFLSRHFFSGIPTYFSLLAAFFYTANTYSFMIVDGGQMGVALAYSISPLVLIRFIKLVEVLDTKAQNFQFLISNVQFPILAGLVFALQVLFDLRVAYITIGIVVLYVVFYYLFVKRFDLKMVAFHFGFFILLVILVHAFWILPLLFFQINPAEQFASIYTTKGAVSFFSFADFSHTFSLLHPNWPENIFGKTYFLQPEFLLLPILAFSSLLFVRRNGFKNIVFFALLALLGAFLAKGANSPFGEVYLWLFEKIPGFFMFRDPTKFYLMVALSYSVLISFSVWQIYQSLKFPISNFQFPIKSIIFNSQNLFLLFTFLFLLFLIRPAWMGELGGTLKSHEIPKEYVELKNFLHSQPMFFRTLWIPQRQRFGYFSLLHPAVPISEITQQQDIGELQKLVQDRGIKYIIVPYDSEGELFITDRQYDERLRQNTKEHLDQIAWLKKIDSFESILIYEVTNPKDSFWILGKGQIFGWDMIRPSTYRVSFQADSGARLFFSDRFDSFWEARIDGETIRAENIGGMNGFTIANSSTHTAIITYAPQTFVYYGLFISVATLLASIAFLLRKR